MKERNAVKGAIVFRSYEINRGTVMPICEAGGCFICVAKMPSFSRKQNCCHEDVVARLGFLDFMLSTIFMPAELQGS